jgi:nitroreductase
MLAAKAMGYDSCPMIGFDPVKVAEIIKLPEHHIIGMLLPVGKAITAANSRSGQLDYKEVVINESF